MLRGLFAVKQPTFLDGLAFDPFSFQQDGLTASEVDIGRGEIVDTTARVKTERKVRVVYQTVDEARAALRAKGIDPTVIECAR